MKRFEYTPERRREKIAERQTLEQRKNAKDKRYYVLDEDLEVADGEYIEELDHE